MDDVVWDDNEAKMITLSTGAKKKTTRLQKIKDLTPTQLTVPHLKKFCVKHQIGGYKNQDKPAICELIVEAKKAQNLQNIMYPTNGGGDTSTATDTGSSKKKKKKKEKKKKKNKSTKPACVKSEGTWYRFLLTLFLQELRPYVTKLGLQPTKNDLDKRRIPHFEVFNKMANIFNDADRNDLKHLPNRHEYWTNCEVAHDIPSDFDDGLTAEEMAEIFDCLNYWYAFCMRKCRKSGNHDRFENFAGGRPYLFLYWQLQQDGPIELVHQSRKLER